MDIRGIKALEPLSRRRMTPDAGIEILRDLLALLSASVFAHNGAIDKFLGDGLMAVFGAPVPSAVDATNAARCALDIQQSIDRWNERCDRTGDAAIRVAVGVHYGDVVQGDVGRESHLELTVVGDTVNIASHVEAYCRSLEAAVLITSAFVDSLYAEGSGKVAEAFADQRAPHPAWPRRANSSLRREKILDLIVGLILGRAHR